MDCTGVGIALGGRSFITCAIGSLASRALPVQTCAMRPSLLDPLFAPLTTLAGVGPKFAPLYDRLLGRDGRPARVSDILMHLPHGGIDRRLRPMLRDAPFGEVITVKVVVEAHRPPPAGRIKAPFRVLVSDDTADMELVFFNARIGQIQTMLPLGATRWLSGKLEMFDGLRQMVHPDRILDEQQLAQLPPVEPIYPLTEGLGPRLVATRPRPHWRSSLPCRNGTMPRCLPSGAGPVSPMRCGPSIIRSIWCRFLPRA